MTRKEKQAEYKKLWSKKNAETIKKYKADWYQNNKERLDKKTALWINNHREDWNDICRKAQKRWRERQNQKIKL